MILEQGHMLFGTMSDVLVALAIARRGVYRNLSATLVDNVETVRDPASNTAAVCADGAAENDVADRYAPISTGPDIIPAVLLSGLNEDSEFNVCMRSAIGNILYIHTHRLEDCLDDLL